MFCSFDERKQVVHTIINGLGILKCTLHRLIREFLFSLQITNWMEDIANEYPDLITKQQVGTTFENRDFYSLKARNDIKCRDSTEFFLFLSSFFAQNFVTFLLYSILEHFCF